MGLPKKRQKIGGRPDEKSAQGCRIRKTGKSSQILKHTVVSQKSRDFDPLQSKNHRIDQSQKNFREGVLVVALVIRRKTSPKKSSQSDLMEKLPEQVDAPEVG